MKNCLNAVMSRARCRKSDFTLQVPIVVQCLLGQTQFGKAHGMAREYFFLLFSECDFNHFDKLVIETNEFSLAVNVVFNLPSVATCSDFVENAELAVYFRMTSTRFHWLDFWRLALPVVVQTT